ncbi:MAG TPA: hypothetical protein VH684_25560 [Xanthobacteraceae bacterium]|jgi:hypothetical protein
MNEYLRAIGREPADFSHERNGARVLLNDLKLVAEQFREHAERISSGRDDDQMNRVLRHIATQTRAA